MDLVKNLYEADLHCHTTASDGVLTPTELLELAVKIGLKGIAITDHDTIHGWKEIEDNGQNYPIRILSGIELSTEWKGKEAHILGYEVDGSSKKFNNQLKVLREAREQRMLKILDRLGAVNIIISIDEVRHFAQGESVGRPHIAQVLLERGIVRSIKEAFDQYIGYGAPAYVPRYKLTPEEGIAIIREARGVAVLAHPGTQRLETGIPEWVEMGLQGVEVFHSEHNSEDEKKYFALAKRYNLIITGGSDFHGNTVKPGVELGFWGVSLDVIDTIQKIARC